MKRLVLIAAFACGFSFLALAGPAQTPQTHGGRYDQQILSNVARILAGNPQYRSVTVNVEDGVVTLAGSVELDSTRRDLSVRVLHIAHVEGVENQLTLEPVATPDHILYSRVLSRLEEAGYKNLTIQVHEGLVVLQGSVPTQHDVNAAKRIVDLTPGVKEVDARLQIATP